MQMRSTLVLCVLAGASMAHDDDWRKLRDLEPPVQAAAVTGATPDDLFREASSSYPHDRVYLTSWLPLNWFPSNPASGNDCWGYVSPSGREYALMGLSTGLSVVEVTDPSNPVHVGFVDGTDSLWRDVKVIGEYAYSVSEGGNGVQVIDLRNVDSGSISHIRDDRNFGHSTTHNIVANPDSGYLYAVGANIANGGLVALSTSNPQNLSISGTWNGSYVHDAQVVTYTSGPYAGREIAFCANGRDGIEVVDVTNKGNMFRIGATEYEDLSYCHQCWLSEDRQYLYVNDELDEASEALLTTSRVFDVSDPANPTLVSMFTSGSTSIDHNLYVKGDLIFEANYTSGLRIFDASNPTAPVEVGYFDTVALDDAPRFSGAWSTYPYLPSGNILISDMGRGLFIVEYDPDHIAFEFVGESIDLVPAGQETVVTIDIAENGTSLVEGSLMMHFFEGEGTEVSVPMVESDGHWQATLPAGECFDQIEFWFTAEGTNGRPFSSPSNAPDQTHVAYVAEEVHEIYADSFESLFGGDWTVGDPNDPDTATHGRWSRAIPQEWDCQPEADHTDDGSICWITDGSANSGSDINGGRTTLMSPVWDMTTMADPAISYWRWYCNTTGIQGQNESFRIDITDDGTTWVNVETLGPTGDGTRGGWIFHEFHVADFVELTSTVQVRFVAEDVPPVDSPVEAAIDDFRLTDAVCTTCPADLTDDGLLDIFDVLAFVGLFSDGAPEADWNEDGFEDIFDVLDYLGDFEAGC